MGVNGGGLRGGDDDQIMRQFVNQTGVSFAVGWDRNSSYRRYRTERGISPFPLDVVIDQQGRIAYVSTQYDRAAIESVVQRLLEQD